MKKLITLIIIAGLFAACSNKSNTVGNDMTANNDMAAKNKARVQEFYDKVMNAHNADVIDQYCTADFVNHQPDPMHSGKGIDDLKGSFKDWFTMMPDLKMTAQEVTTEGNKVWVKFS